VVTLVQGSSESVGGPSARGEGLRWSAVELNIGSENDSPTGDYLLLLVLVRTTSTKRSSAVLLWTGLVLVVRYILHTVVVQSLVT